MSDSLGVGKPADDVLVAADQPILIRDWRAKALFGLFALHFDAPAVIFAGGLELACQPALIPA